MCSTSAKPRLFAALTAALVSLSPLAASADEPAHTGADPGHHRFITGANAVALGAIAHGQMAAEFGPGAFFEVVAVPHWLEIELAAHFLRTTTKETEVPLELVFKKPFHPTAWLNPYLGLGPMVILGINHGAAATHAGLATAAGTYFWITPHFGISAEVDYNLVSSHGLLQEVAGGSGVVVGF